MNIPVVINVHELYKELTETMQYTIVYKKRVC